MKQLLRAHAHYYGGGGGLGVGETRGGQIRAILAHNAAMTGFAEYSVIRSLLH